MTYIDKTCREFAEATASKEPVPGGGSVSALVGSLGTALGNMTGAFTLGKKKYASVEAEMRTLMEEACQLKEELLELVQKDIDIFESLLELYRRKPLSEDEQAEKDRKLEEALERACGIPMDIMKKCGRAIELSKIFAEKGNSMVISDAGAGAVICKAALQAASLNVYINANSMKDVKKAEELRAFCFEYLSKYSRAADEVFDYVTVKLRGEI